MRWFMLAAVTAVSACGGGSGAGGDAAGDDAIDAPPGTPDAPPGTPDAPPAIVDDDGDGLDDADEMAWAIAYRPFLSVADNDGCALGGIVLRVFPHPDDPTLVAII